MFNNNKKVYDVFDNIRDLKKDIDKLEKIKKSKFLKLELSYIKTSGYRTCDSIEDTSLILAKCFYDGVDKNLKALKEELKMAFKHSKQLGHAVRFETPEEVEQRKALKVEKITSQLEDLHKKNKPEKVEKLEVEKTEIKELKEESKTDTIDKFSEHKLFPLPFNFEAEMHDLRTKYGDNLVLKHWQKLKLREKTETEINLVKNSLEIEQNKKTNSPLPLPQNETENARSLA